MFEPLKMSKLGYIILRRKKLLIGVLFLFLGIGLILGIQHYRTADSVYQRELEEYKQETFELRQQAYSNIQSFYCFNKENDQIAHNALGDVSALLSLSEQNYQKNIKTLINTLTRRDIVNVYVTDLQSWPESMNSRLHEFVSINMYSDSNILEIRVYMEDEVDATFLLGELVDKTYQLLEQLNMQDNIALQDFDQYRQENLGLLQGISQQKPLLDDSYKRIAQYAVVWFLMGLLVWAGINVILHMQHPVVYTKEDLDQILEVDSIILEDQKYYYQIQRVANQIVKNASTKQPCFVQISSSIHIDKLDAIVQDIVFGIRRLGHRCCMANLEKNELPETTAIPVFLVENYSNYEFVLLCNSGFSISENAIILNQFAEGCFLIERQSKSLVSILINRAEYGIDNTIWGAALCTQSVFNRLGNN